MNSKRNVIWELLNVINFKYFFLSYSAPVAFITSPGDVPNDDDWFANLKQSAPQTPCQDPPAFTQPPPVNSIPSDSTIPSALSTEPSPLEKSPEKTANSSKANAMFGRNLDRWGVGGAPPAGTGMSPLDTLPPMPPVDDGEDGDEFASQSFDHFGTFQGMSMILLIWNPMEKYI